MRTSWTYKWFGGDKEAVWQDSDVLFLDVWKPTKSPDDNCVVHDPSLDRDEA